MLELKDSNFIKYSLPAEIIVSLPLAAIVKSEKPNDESRPIASTPSLKSARVSASLILEPPSPERITITSEPVPLTRVSAPVPPSKVLSPADAYKASSPEPP